MTYFGINTFGQILRYVGIVVLLTGLFLSNAVAIIGGLTLLASMVAPPVLKRVLFMSKNLRAKRDHRRRTHAPLS